MNNKLICPFCGEEIISDLCLMCDKIDKGYTSGRQIYKCNKCSLFGNKELWQALIQAKQDLEIARQALEEIDTLLLSRKFDITELGRLNIIQYLVSRALKLTEHKE